MADEIQYTDAGENESGNINIFGGMGKILFGILVVGLVIGAIIFSMNLLKTELLKINIEFSETAQYSDLQEIFGVYLYPILNITGFLSFLCHLYIVLLIIGFWIMAYQIGTKPVYLGLSVLFLIIVTYFSVLISNFYVDLTESPVVTELVSELTYYHFFMSNFPWFVFLIGLVGILISLINFQKPPTNEIKENELY
jgi:hypothetical protein